MKSARTQQENHIRPQIRSRPTQSPPVKPPPPPPAQGDVDKLVEHTRQRIQSRLKVSSHDKHDGGNETKVAPQQLNAQSTLTVVSNGGPPNKAPKQNASQPKSILKTPKYSSSQNQPVRNDPMIVSKTFMDDSKPVAENIPRAAVKDVVVEREPIPQTPPSEPEPLSVEGYTPNTHNATHKVAHSKEPIVFSSISELMDKAGTFPVEGSTSQVVEADLSFACMTSEEYDETIKQAESLDPSKLNDDNVANYPETRNNHFADQDEVFSDDDREWSGDDENDDPMYGGSDDSEEELPAPEPRAFIKLWDAITGWATPEAIALLKEWRESDTNSVVDSVPLVDQSDVGSSRRKGLQAMLNMYLSPSMKDLGLPQDARRKVEFRLNNFLRTLNYSNAMAKFDSSMWKVMTCIFVDMVLIDSSTAAQTTKTLPAAAKDVGMVTEEYMYLTRSAVINLGS